MTRCCVSLDGLAAWREALGEGPDFAAAVALVDLAGGGRVRLCVSEALQPVTDADLHRLARSGPALEVCMPPSQALLRLAQEVRPDRVLLVEEDRYGTYSYGPLDFHKADREIAPILRGLEEADLPVGAVIAPDIENVKAAHGIGFKSLEFYSRYAADLPAAKRQPELERLSDASMLAAKLKFDIGVGGGLDFQNVEEILNAVPMALQVSVGRGILTRALLIGLERAVRDFRALIS